MNDNLMWVAIISIFVLAYGFEVYLERNDTAQAVKAGLQQCVVKTGTYSTAIVWQKECSK